MPKFNVAISKKIPKQLAIYMWTVIIPLEMLLAPQILAVPEKYWHDRFLPIIVSCVNTLTINYQYFANCQFDNYQYYVNVV